MCRKSSTLKQLPSFEKLRTDRVLPRWRKSTADTIPKSRKPPEQDMADPTRARARIASAEPMWRKSNMLSELPKRPKDRRLIDEENRVMSKILKSERRHALE
jgi:hypothetical protein